MKYMYHVIYAGISYCGVWARVTSLGIFIFTWAFLLLTNGFAIYIFNFTNFFDLVLTPFTGQESYASTIKSK